MATLEEINRDIPILVVDDFSAMRRIIRNCLKQLGFENVSEALDGKEALDKLKAENFKLVIADWSLPEIQGLELLKKLRSDSNYKGVPFLMITAETQKNGAVEATKAGASSCIVKPFTADTLRTKLEAIL